ncbi:MAG: TIGR02300 family protein [Rhodospirillaceae bacterium]|mgnify:FL=1|nr:TIGR02300 family protein [Alphaproteobacteria bacterium]MBT4932126.1 TIGR02300 family protein [Rhodospirillaceae bacterium]MBT5244982.1 TIGR02300 family protein [Rhodospirillaceae bacterium]MBT5561186.1 TIGR02300 family protein [Rhodospirillaceae bacterium]MBT6243063.1 TIGR02300 family protein [Rhodospirillaceae bacterium]
MKKPNLGQKQTCKKCEARFFDLNKNPSVCPKCGEAFKTAKPRVKRAAVVPEEVVVVETPSPEAAPVAAETPEAPSDDGEAKTDDEVDDLEAELEEDQDDGLMEDTSDIGEDSDELSEVLEHVDDGVGDK